MIKKNKFIKDFFLLNIGFIILSFTIVNCLIPSKLTGGGTTGIAMVLYHLYNTSISFGFFILNLPLVILGFYVFGKEYGFRTIYGIITISIYTEIISKWVKIEFFQLFFNFSPLSGAVIGGILTGIGVGIVLEAKGNTGGTTILAQILEKYFNIKIGTTLIIVDTGIIIISGILLGGYTALFTICSLIICGKIINIIKYKKKRGGVYEKNT